MNDWKTVKLSDICILEKGQQIDTSLLDDSKPFRYINGGIKESGYFDNFNTSGESVLISEGGASCGYINYVNENFWCGCHCYRLHDIKVFPKYLFHALKANQQRIMALRTGSAMPNIQKSTIQKFELKIHDDSTTQKKVSTMLDKCNELIEKHKQTLEKYDTLIKSRFIEMFGDPVQNPMGWEVKKLGDICTKISDGVHAKPEYTATGKPFISVVNINSGKLLFDDCKYVSEEAYEKMIKSTHPEKGDILYTKVGATYGIPALVDTDRAFCLYVSVALLKPKSEIVNSQFLTTSMAQPYIKNQADKRIKGIGVPDLHLNQIREFEVLVPPLELQNHFNSFVQQIDKSKFVVQKSLEKAETLYKSLMQEYFG